MYFYKTVRNNILPKQSFIYFPDPIPYLHYLSPLLSLDNATSDERVKDR